MIKVRLNEEGLEVSGHAARPPGVPVGQNIVCAAVSALTLTLVDGMQQVAGEEVAVTIDDGLVRITWQRLGEKGRALIDTWLLGMQRIREGYGQIEIV